MLNLSRNSVTYDGSAFFQDDSGIAEKKIPLNRLVSWEISRSSHTRTRRLKALRLPLRKWSALPDNRHSRRREVPHYRGTQPRESLRKARLD